MGNALPTPQLESQDTPGDVGRFGMLLFLAALTMLFAAGMLAYILVRTQAINPGRSPEPPLGTLRLPWGLWVSTVVILASSFTLHAALRQLRTGNTSRSAKSMNLAFWLAIAFLIIQIPCLWMLIQRHHEMTKVNVFLYSLMAMLIVVHALHVIGGIIPLGVVTFWAQRGAYTPESHRPLAYLTMYWHFIDVVWLIMFGVFLLLG